MEFMASLRFLARRKAITAVAILTMALALGANTAALAVVRAFFFASLAVPEPERLLNIAPVRDLPGRPATQFSDAWPNYRMLRETQTAFTDVAAMFQNTVGWESNGDSRPLTASHATASFFQTMDVEPALGRGFTPDEEGPSRSVIVIGHGLWQAAFAGDRNVLGRSMTIDGRPMTIIGVMPKGFTQPLQSEVWLPFDIPAQNRTQITGARGLTIFGRLAPGRTLETAQSDMDALTRRSLEAHPVDNRDFKYTIRSVREMLLGPANDSALLIQVGAIILLILAALNLSSLLVAWGLERQQEMAVRRALGGGASQVVRLFLVQGVLVVGAGCVLGLVVAQFAIISVRQLELGPAIGLFLTRVSFDPVVFAAAALGAGVAAVAASLLPAWLARRGDLASALRTASRSSSQSGAALRAQRGMVVLQSSLSVVVLAAAVIVGVSFRNLAGVPDGFESNERDVAHVILPNVNYATHAKRVAFAGALERALEQETELGGFGFTTTLPVVDVRNGGRYHIPDANGAIGNDPLLLHNRRVSPGYLPVMGIPLIRGRQFTAQDDSASPPVAIISQDVVRQYFEGRDPIGQRILRVTPAGNVPVEVVGVVGDVMDGGYEAPKGQAVYVPYSQVSYGQMSIVVRHKSNTGAAIAAVRRAVKAADPLVAASGISTMDALVVQANALPRLRAAILLAFSIVAALIAALGSYGVMRQLAASREREFAIRLVFGAVPTDLGRAVLTQVVRLTVPGVVLGLIGAWFAASALRPFVFGIDPRSLVILAVVSAGVLVMGAVTALPTALRAMRIDAKTGITAA